MNFDNWKLVYYLASLSSVSQTSVVVLPVKNINFLNVNKLLYSFFF